MTTSRTRKWWQLGRNRQTVFVSFTLQCDIQTHIKRGSWRGATMLSEHFAYKKIIIYLNSNGCEFNMRLMWNMISLLSANLLSSLQFFNERGSIAWRCIRDEIQWNQKAWSHFAISVVCLAHFFTVWSINNFLQWTLLTHRQYFTEKTISVEIFYWYFNHFVFFLSY